MKIQRTKNAARNIVFDGALKMMNLLVPFFMRTIILRYLGLEYLGLGGLFRSILSFLNLAELGVGSAMVFSMYKPIAEDDTEAICGLLKLYRTVYRVIGLVIAAIGLSLTPFLNTLIKGDVTADVNLYVLYFMNLGSTVMTYWLFAYKNSLLYAHQRNDVGSKVSMTVHMAEYALKILGLMVFHSYYLYLGIQIIAQIAINICTAWRVTKLYPAYKPTVNLPKEKKLDIARRVRDLFTSNFSAVVSDSADTLVISSFLGLEVLAVYQNYYYIVTSLRGMLDVVGGACMAGIGNSLVCENDEKNYEVLKKLTIMYGWLMALSSAMLLCMFQPFMTIWMGEENLLGLNYVVCFAIYYYSLGMNRLVNMFKDAAGIWRKDRWRPLTAALVNLGLNLATVRWLGLYGVLLSTVIAIAVVQLPWLLHNLFQAVFPRKYLWQYTRMFFGFVLIGIASCAASWFACSFIQLDEWPLLIVSACISFVIPNVILFALFRKNGLFLDLAAQIKNVLLKKVTGKAD